MLPVARQTGGMKGGLGLAEDRAEASLACRQTGPISFKGDLKDGEEVFKERTSLVFKTMQVVRFLDKAQYVGVSGVQRSLDRRQSAECRYRDSYLAVAARLIACNKKAATGTGL